MPRRKHGLFDVLLGVSWWVGIVIGIVGYGAITWLLPSLWTDRMLAAIAKGIRPVGLLWLAVCFVAAVGSALRSVFIRKKFQRQESLHDIRKLSWQQFEMIVGEAFRRRPINVHTREIHELSK